MRQALRTLTIVAAAAVMSQAPVAAAQSPQDVIVYRGAMLFDGLGGALRPNLNIVTLGDTIVAVEDTDTPPPENARVIDVDGLYVLPGLIDTHVHIATPPDAAAARRDMRRWVYSGVTAVRDMADDLRSVAELAREARNGETPSPDIYFAALVAGPTFFDDPRTRSVSVGYAPGTAPWMQAIGPETDLATAVAIARGTGATALKIYANLPGETVARITSEAHRQGLPVWAHAMVYPATPAEVAAAGPDVMSHVCSLAHQGQAPDDRPVSYNTRQAIDRVAFLGGDNPAVQEVLLAMRDSGILLDATVRVYFEQDRLVAADPSRKPPLCSGPMTAALAGQAYRAGVRITAGTDGETNPADPWPALYEELSLLQNVVGMTPRDVLMAATATAAEAANQSDMGTIQPGKLANLIFVAEDPTVDVEALKTLKFTVKRGRIFAREEYVAPAPSDP